MLTPADVRFLATLTQKECSTAIRIAAKLIEEGKALTERGLKGLLKIEDIKWEEMKPSLSKVFQIRAGKVDFMGDELPMAAWECMTQEDELRLAKALETQDRRSKIVLSDLEAAIHDLGGLTPAEARSVHYSLKGRYGLEMLASAVKKSAGRRPSDPRGYLISIIKAAMGDAARAGSTIVRRHVQSYVKPTTVGPGTTQYIGWEAPASLSEAGEPIWPVGEARSKLYRFSDGYVRRERPKEGEHVPTLAEDGGYTIR